MNPYEPPESREIIDDMLEDIELNARRHGCVFGFMMGVSIPLLLNFLGVI